MNAKLEKFILELIKGRGGKADLRDIINKATRKYWPNEQPLIINPMIEHQLFLMEENKLVKKRVQLPNVFPSFTIYELTPLGYQKLDSFSLRNKSQKIIKQVFELLLKLFIFFFKK